MRFVYHWYALAGPGPEPRWRWRSGVKRGAKGTGKDPLLALLALAELCGPTFPVWDGSALWSGGQPVARSIGGGHWTLPTAGLGGWLFARWGPTRWGPPCKVSLSV